MKKFVVGIMLVSIIFVSLFLVSETHAKDPIVLKMATFLAKNDTTATAWRPLIDEINTKGKGEIVIKYVGGPEAIPAFKQFEAVKTGVVDMIFACEAYYGAEVAKALGAPFSVAIVRKIRIPGTTESGFGAVTWEGRVLINERLRAALGLSDTEVKRSVAATMDNVTERVARFTGRNPVPEMTGKTVILTDDGLASGLTMLAAVQAIRFHKPAGILVAIPTASLSSAELVAREADLVVCLNIRSGHTFAVADAYREWHDLEDNEVLEELAKIP